MQLTITKFHDSKSGQKDGKFGQFTWYSCGAQFAEHGDKWFNGFIKDYELRKFGVQYPKEMIGKKVEVELSQEEYNGKMQDKFLLTIPKGEKGGTFTDEDRKKLDTIYSYVIAQTTRTAQSMSEPEALTEDNIPF